MNPSSIPSLEEYLTWPAAKVAQVAPEAVVLAIGGTRRAAALAGVPLEQMAEFTLPQMFAACRLHFRLGIRHLFLPVASPRMFQETGLYRDRLLQWLCSGLAGSESCQTYQTDGWRVRLIIAGEQIPELTEAATAVDAATRNIDGPRLWFLVITGHEALWQWQIKAFTQGARSRSEAIQYLFGEVVPPADLLISYGKPFIALDVIPPLLYEETHAYWRQKPGYAIDETELRTILYDYTYTRQTWRQDKTGRAEQALIHQKTLESAPPLGLGLQLGPFWYPAPFPPPQTLDTISDD